MNKRRLDGRDKSLFTVVWHLCTSINVRRLHTDKNNYYNAKTNNYYYFTKTNSAFHPSGVGKWVTASAGKAKAGMVHSVRGWTRGVQVKLWDPLRKRAIPERLRGVFTMRRYTNPRLPLPLPLLPMLHTTTTTMTATTTKVKVNVEFYSAVWWTHL